jgi:hypothetical protein
VVVPAFTLSNLPRRDFETAELPRTTSQSTYDRHEIHEPTNPPSQRQQKPAQPQPNPTSIPSERVSSPASSQHRLRRTPKFEATPSPEPRLVHIAAASVGFSPEPSPPRDEGSRTEEQRDRRRARRQASRSERRRIPSQDLSENLDEHSSEYVPSEVRADPSSARPRQQEGHPAVRISKRTHSAILYALEEALRQPNPFTPDLAEESASMADLMSGGGGPPPSNRHNLTPPDLPAPPPVSTTPPSAIKSPKMIMKARVEREARKQEAERLEREERERLRQEEQLRIRAAEQLSAGVAGTQPNPTRPTEIPITPRVETAHSVDVRRKEATDYPSSSQHHQPSQSRHRRNPPSQHQQPPSQGQAHLPQTPKAETPSPPAGPSSGSKPRNSFPHAFERWETLSAHWEGLTSYWIRRLEQNKDELSRDPVSQQLARQVTDLSAAGANLFHAVVELQRLRASSERKFQRWFFETRAELERAHEEKTLLEDALRQEKRGREEAIREAVERDQGSSLAQKQLNEMRKELAISKDEARRAWEELGRREQAERDRTLSLQSGQPTIVGGVQVVPMTQSSRQTQAYQQSYAPDSVPSPSPAGGSSGYYQHQQPSHQQPAQPYPGAPERGYSGGEYVVDVQGNPILDVRGNKIPVAVPSSNSGSDREADDYNTPATTGPPSGSYDPSQPSAPGAQPWSGEYSEDYSGQGYGDDWVDPPPATHHHPTRLSDVIEEDDERSRTSASQISRA